MTPSPAMALRRLLEAAPLEVPALGRRFLVRQEASPTDDAEEVLVKLDLLGRATSGTIPFGRYVYKMPPGAPCRLEVLELEEAAERWFGTTDRARVEQAVLAALAAVAHGNLGAWGLDLPAVRAGWLAGAQAALALAGQDTQPLGLRTILAMVSGQLVTYAAEGGGGPVATDALLRSLFMLAEHQDLPPEAAALFAALSVRLLQHVRARAASMGSLADAAHALGHAAAAMVAAAEAETARLLSSFAGGRYPQRRARLVSTLAHAAGGALRLADLVSRGERPPAELVGSFLRRIEEELQDLQDLQEFNEGVRASLRHTCLVLGQVTGDLAWTYALGAGGSMADLLVDPPEEGSK